MKKIAALLFVLPVLLNAHGQVNLPQTPPARSKSGQFVIYGVPRPSFVSSRIATNTALMQLDPTALTVSCERVKQALLTELTARDNWRGKVFVVLHHAQGADEQVVITSENFLDRWNYRMDLPDAIEPVRFVHAMTEVLLSEMANRNAGTRPAELPAWLPEGMAELIRGSSTMDLVVKPPQFSSRELQFMTRSREWTNYVPLAHAQQILANRPPLAFDELSWPRPEQLQGDAGEVYRASAHLFVHSLLRLKNGRAEFRDFIFSLSKQLNWQLPFLEAFHADFPSQLDLEKWWALESVHFAGRNLASLWTLEESWKKLGDILRPEVQVHVRANEFPLHADVSLQAIIREWDYLRQTQTLRAKIRQLGDAQLRVAPRLLMLTSQYRQTLEDYLRRMEKAGPMPFGKNQMKQSVKKTIEDTLKQLDALDAKAEALRTMPIAKQ